MAGDSEMTPPSAGAVAKERGWLLTSQCFMLGHVRSQGIACSGCIALALDAFARERCDSREWQTAFRAREAAVWEEAIKIADTVRDQDIAAALRARAAEARRTG